MFDDSNCNATDMDGFQFDWDTNEQPEIDLNYNLFLESQLINEQVSTMESEKPTCVNCHNLIEGTVYYEHKITFCSEYCWKSILYTAMDDFCVGGMCAWPLDTFCSYEAKAFLLKLACASGDGEFITKLLLHFQASLSPHILRRLLFGNRIAFNHYTNFLRKTGQNKQLHECFTSCGFIEHAKVQNYCLLLQKLDMVDINNVENLTHQLDLFSTTELRDNSRLQLLQETCGQLCNLLQFQHKQQHDWDSYCRAEYESPQPSTNLLALSISETVRACALMDNNLSSSSRCHQLRIQYKVADDQFRWWAVEPLVRKSNWIEMDSLLLEKKWLKRHVTTCLPNDRLVLYLHALNAPEDIVSNYLSYSDQPGEMIAIAARLRLYSVALRLCMKLKDQALMKELLSFIPKSEPQFKQVFYYTTLPVSQWKL